MLNAYAWSGMICTIKIICPWFVVLLIRLGQLKNKTPQIYAHTLVAESQVKEGEVSAELEEEEGYSQRHDRCGHK